MTDFERMQAFSYLDGAADGLKEARNDVIEELEEINAEIDALYEVYNSHFKERLVIKTDAMQILDNHITELKGV